MKHPKKELDEMSRNIGKTVRRYHCAIGENLREIGKPVRVQGDDDDVEGIEVSVEHDGNLFPWVIDLIKWDEEKNEVMVHTTMMNYCDSDDWYYLSELGDATDYVLDVIQWGDTEKEDVFPLAVCNYNNGEGFWTVDAWKKKEEDAEETGQVVAVIHEKTGDVFYVNQMARTSATVQEVIRMKKEEIDNTNTVTTYTLFGKTAVRAYHDYLDLTEEALKDKDMVQENIKAMKEILSRCDYELKTRTFGSSIGDHYKNPTQYAYFCGMDDADGWEEYCELTKAEYDLIRSMKE